MKINNQHSDFINFRKYYTGNMSSEEKVAFEKHLEEDPFAKEAYEGFLFLENDHARISAIEQTNMALKEKFGLQNSSNIFPMKYIITVAASLVLFIGSYVVIQNNFSNKNENLAENHVEELDISEIVEEEEIQAEIIDSLENDTFSDSLIENEEDFLDNNDIIITEVQKSTKEKTSPIVEKEPVSIAESVEISENKSNASKKIKAEKEEVSALLENTKEEPQIQIAGKDKYRQATNTIYADESEITEVNNLSEYKNGINAYNNSEYTKAIKFFNNSINQNRSVSGSNYYIGMSYFNQDKSLKAIKYFDKTIEIGSTFTENAKWYKSLTLLNRGDKAEAKELLNSIINSNSSFKNAAVKKLETID